MARPKTRTLRHELRLTPAEKESRSVQASQVGLDGECEYIRRCVERRAIAPVPPEVNRLTAVELGRIGVDLNQLAAGDEHSDRVASKALRSSHRVNKLHPLTAVAANDRVINKDR
jgi:hypothetical protein